MLILVTRPEPQASDWAQALQREGAQARALPLIAIGPPPDTLAVQEAWQALHQTRLVMFVSPNAAIWFARCRPPNTSWPATTLAAAPGPGTARALTEALAPIGLTEANLLCPPHDSEQFDSEHLWPILAPRSWAAQRVLIVSGGDTGQARGRQWLSERLLAAGATVGTVLTYQRGCAQWNDTARAVGLQAYADPSSHLWLLSSSEAVAHLVSLLGPPPVGAQALATHPRVADTARQAGFEHVALTRPLPEAVAQARRSLLGSVDTMKSP